MPSAVRIMEKYYLQFLHSVFQSVIGKTCTKMKLTNMQNYTFSVLNMND